MKFVGTIKGRHYLIDPETYESELREKIAQEIKDEFDGDCNGCYCEGLSKAIDIARGQMLPV